jgi:hypothetical protein
LTGASPARAVRLRLAYSTRHFHRHPLSVRGNIPISCTPNERVCSGMSTRVSRYVVKKIGFKPKSLAKTEFNTHIRNTLFCCQVN